MSQMDTSEDSVKRNCFFPTSDGLIIGLLAVLGFLWMTERYGWFGLGHKKGWPVLISVATVFVAAVLTLLCFTIWPRFRSFFQYRIRSLFLLTLMTAILCAWLSVEMQEAQRQRKAVQSVLDAGGSVDYGAGQGPGAIRRQLGDEFSSRTPNPPVRRLPRMFSEEALTLQNGPTTIL
jgi:hypothetical protein